MMAGLNPGGPVTARDFEVGRSFHQMLEAETLMISRPRRCLESLSHNPAMVLLHKRRDKPSNSHVSQGHYFLILLFLAKKSR